MSAASLPRWGLSLERLAVQARRGDRRAVAALRARMAPELRQLSLALCADPSAVPGVVRGALADALADDGRPYTVALVAAVQRRAGAARARGGATALRSAPERLRQAVGVLCDVQGHSHASAAALLGQPVGAVAALHAESRTTLGVDERHNDCRGWHLVSRMDGLTPPEQAAGRAHLEACRRCRDALDARATARTRLKAAVPVGGTAVGGAVVALLSTLGGGSMAAGAVAVGAAAVLGTASVTVPALAPPAPADAQITVRQDSAPGTPQDAGEAVDGATDPVEAPVVDDPALQLSSVDPGGTPDPLPPGDPARPTDPPAQPEPDEPDTEPTTPPGPAPTPLPLPLPPLPLPLPEPTLPVPLPTESPLPLLPAPSPTVSPLPVLDPVLP